MSQPHKFLLASLIVTALSRPSFAAEEDWSLCRIPSFLFESPADIAVDETRVEASSIASESSELLQLSGDVNLQRRDQQLSADEVLIDKANDLITASGNASYADPNYRINSPEIHVDNANSRADFDQPSFQLNQRHGRGQAGSIQKIDDDRSRYLDLVYTTCDPEDGAWHMRAAELEIDRASGRGEATHTTMYIQDVPVLYMPYFQFPIDDRRMSGILTPRLGFSSSDGSSLQVPIYWNQAPNYDMTITPAWYSKRGLQLNTENRYLFGSNRGHIDLSYIDDSDFDDTRWFQQWRHKTDLPYDIDAGFLFAEASDRDFFDDFDSVAPEYNDTRHLERYVRFRRDEANWQSELIWQDYQTLNENSNIKNRPYNSLPRFSLGLQPEYERAELGTPVSYEWASFERDESVDGRRSHLVTSLNWNAEDSWYFLRPDLQFAFTDYQLEDNPGGDSISRALPTFGMDTGLIFDRLTGGDNQLRQTLEPRLYFLHTPFEDQDDIPDFDTSKVSNTYNNLFRNNRFNGADRIGDATQITYALATRLFDDSNGDELLNARIGQIYFFKDRRVSLNGKTETEQRSDIISEIDFRPNSTLSFNTRVVYDPESEEWTDRDFSAGYANRGLAANLGYYYTENKLEQALVSAAYPINERWEVVAKLHHSLLFDEPVENLLGISYESCCWGLKILAGQTGDEKDDFADTENSIYFEFTFKGLSQAGQDIDSQLSDAIPGYRPAF